MCVPAHSASRSVRNAATRNAPALSRSTTTPPMAIDIGAVSGPRFGANLKARIDDAANSDSGD